MLGRPAFCYAAIPFPLSSSPFRIWDVASEETTPEVFHLQRKMKETGVDMLIDCHADETLPYNFLAGIEGNL